MIVLINPRCEISYQPPLGLAYLAAYLKKFGYSDVQIIDTTFESLEKKLGTISRPSLFGIYIMTPYYNRAAKAIEYLKRRSPGVPIIAGGPHPTVDPEGVLNNLAITACVRGEGEAAFLEVVKTIEDGAALSKIHGISYIDSATKKIVHTPDRATIQDIDTIPFPARELLPMGHYLRGGTQKTFLYRDIKVTTMISSRGCPFGCTYCQPTLNKLFGYKVRFRSVDSVIKEIDRLICDYSVAGIFFVDDTFTCNKKFVMQFCEEILRKGIDLKFALNSRIDTVDEEMLAMLKKAGTDTIMYGIESGNQAILDSIRKKLTIKQREESVIATKNAGINVYGYFMIGSTEESRSSLDDTFNLAKNLPFDEVQFSMAAPYPGTYLYDEAKACGLIADPSVIRSGGYFSSAAMRSKYLSAEDIRKFYRRVNAFSIYKSIANILVRYPSAILPLFLNKIFAKIINKRKM